MAGKKPTNWGMWIKMFFGGGAICVGGPALVMYVQPTPEELFKKYNPELQARSLANRDQKQQEFDDFVCKLKEYSKDSRPIWVVQAEAEKKERELRKLQVKKSDEEDRIRKEAIRREALGPTDK